MTDKFHEFIKSKRQEKQTDTDSASQTTPEQEKELWIKKLEELYALVNDCLCAYVESGDITMNRVPITLQEELLGSYEVNQLEIFLGRQLIRLKPVGTFLIGARGRVDMLGPRGIVRFVIVPPALEKPGFRSASIETENVASPIPKQPPPEEWVWKISTLPPQITFIELTSDSFQEALMGVIDGDI